MEEKKSTDELKKEYRLLLFLSVVKQLQPSVREWKPIWHRKAENLKTSSLGVKKNPS